MLYRIVIERSILDMRAIQSESAVECSWELEGFEKLQTEQDLTPRNCEHHVMKI